VSGKPGQTPVDVVTSEFDRRCGGVVEGVTGAASFLVAALSFVALASWKAPAWAVVFAAAGLGIVLL